MIGAWMLYGLAVGALLAAAAAALERVLRAYGRPARWAWAGAVAGTLAAPAAAWLLAGWPEASGAAGGVVLGSPEMVAAAPPASSLAASARALVEALDGPLAALWVLASAALVLRVLAAAAGLRRRRRLWRVDSVEGERVLVSPDAGPAVMGFLRGTVILPEWVLALEPERRRLVVAHEREHARAHDPALLALGIAALAVTPWNAALWWQVRRLRLAVEMDCDERVLRAHPDVSAYGGLLLEVGRRASLAGALVAALSEPRSFLERRIRRMVHGRGPRRVVQIVGLAIVSAAVLVLACEVPAPDRVIGVEEPGADTLGALGRVRATMEELAEQPVPTPFTRAPELENRDEVARALADLYPPLVRDAGIGGTAVIWFLIDETGTVRATRIKESTGHEALDQAALKVAERMRFTPAMNRSNTVPVWVSMPIVFGSADEPAPRRREPPSPESASGAGSAARPGAEDLAREPVMTPYTVAPQLKNRTEVELALVQEYPPLLRDAGIGGDIVVWFLIDETGAVRQLLTKTSSGHPALDEAALRVASRMEFTPALNREKKVPVWVALPITFSAK